MKDKYLIIYHKEDNDGVFSGALFYEYLLNDLHISNDLIDLLPADYNYLNEISKEYTADLLHNTYKTILMADISFNDINFMKSLYDEFKNEFVWCDHHAPVIKLTNKTKLVNIPGIRDTSCSAILCVWRYLYDPFNVDYDKTPELLKVLSAWDSWTYKEKGYKFEYVKYINIGVIKEYQLDINKVIPIITKLKYDYLNDNINEEYNNAYLKLFYDYGNIIDSYQDYINNTIIENSGDCTWKIYTGEYLNDGEPVWRSACAVFIQGSTNSTMFKSLIHNNNSDIMNGIVFKRTNNGNWTISLYNIRDYEPAVDLGGFHCGEYLKKYYNGGGHQGAAGCTVSEEQFIEILKHKALGYENI